MIRVLVCLFLALAAPVAAQVATVRSGEHDVFSRLVIEAPGAAEWQFGRTDDGYELHLGNSAWRYDLGGVFDQIPRNRLASIRVDQATGRLRLGIGCACHAVPFEFRPGIIVIDLKDGPPPEGSAFELALDGGAPAVMDAHPMLRPRQRPASLTVAAPSQSDHSYDWLSVRQDPAPALPVPMAEALGLADPAMVDPAALAPLRDALLAQLSKGMAEGVIDMADPGPRPDASASPLGENSQIRLAVGDLPGLVAGRTRTASGTLQADGAVCVPDADLAIQDWGKDGAVSETLAEARAGLVTEFDAPDAEAVKRAARQMIHLGFGAEARQLLESFPPSASDPETDLLASLSRLVDGGSDPEGPFPAMAVCDSTAALWAALASEPPMAAPALRTDAVARGFSALPAHLRKFLGPRLVERFMSVGDDSAVQAIREAIERAPGAMPPEVAVMDAQLALEDDRPEAAETQATEVIEAAGPAMAEAMLALVAAQVAQTKPVAAETVISLEALLAEHAGSALEQQLKHALVLGKIAAGDATGGFADLPMTPDAEPEAWRLFATLGSDSDILDLAMVPLAKPPPETTPAVASQIAARLVGLGFPEAALGWLGPFDPAWNPAQRLLYAQAELQRRDARAALRSLAGLTDPDAETLRATAYTQLGDPEAASRAYAAAGDADQTGRVQVWAEDWATLAKDGPEVWRAAAATLGDTDAAGLEGPLARSSALLEAASADRAALSALLSAVPLAVDTP